MEQSELEAALGKSLTPLTEKVDDLSAKALAYVEAVETIKTRLTTLEEEQKNYVAPTAPPASDQKKFNFLNILKAIKHGSNSFAETEIGLLKEYWQVNAHMLATPGQKDLVTNIDTAGGFIVPNEYRGDLYIDRLRAKVIARQLGAQDLSGLQGSPVEIPKLTGSATMNSTAEAAAIAESEQTFGELKLTTKKIAAFVPVSNTLLQQSDPSVGQLISDDFLNIDARKEDLLAFKGTGAGNQPLGIFNNGAIPTGGTLAGVSAATDLDLLIDFQEVQHANDGNLVSMGWAMSQVAWSVLRKLKDLDDRYFFDPNSAMPGETPILGAPFQTSTQLASGDIVYGDFNDLIMATWGAVEIRSSDVAGDAFSNDLTYFRIIHLMDIGVRQGDSFVKQTDLA